MRIIFIKRKGKKMKTKISTKDTQKHTVIKSVWTSIIVFVIFILLCCVGASMTSPSSSYNNEADPMILMSALCGIMAFVIPAVLIFSSAKYSKTYIEIDQETISGQGMEMINGSREGNIIYFNMNYQQLKNVAIKSGWITLYTDVVTYKILTDKNTAIEIYNFYNQNKQKAPSKGTLSFDAE